MWGWHEGFGLFDYLDRLRGSLRLKDLHGRMRALDLSKFQPPMPVNSPLLFLTALIRSCDEVVAASSSAKRIGKGNSLPQMTERLWLCSLLRSTWSLPMPDAIRTEKPEARLETPIDAFPIVVVLLNAPTYEAVSYNGEAARILEAIRMPDKAVQQLLGLVKVRRANGREMSLQKSPLPRRCAQ